jgi:hypothetical protein
VASLVQVEPRQLLVPEKVLGRPQARRIVERADVEVRFGRHNRKFARQRGTTPPAKPRTVPGEEFNFVIAVVTT